MHANVCLTVNQPNAFIIINRYINTETQQSLEAHYTRSATQLLCFNIYSYYYTRLTAFYQDNLGKPATERANHSGFYWSKR